MCVYIRPRFSTTCRLLVCYRLRLVHSRRPPFASRAALAVFEPDPARAVNPANAAAYGSNAVPARGVRAIRTERAAARRLWTSPPGVPYPDLP